MAHVIAVAGKGGVGKTTLCGLLIQYLCESGKGPVLAVDADANSNLNEVLGVEVEATLGGKNTGKRLLLFRQWTSAEPARKTVPELSFYGSR